MGRESGQPSAVRRARINGSPHNVGDQPARRARSAVDAASPGQGSSGRESSIRPVCAGAPGSLGSRSDAAAAQSPRPCSPAHLREAHGSAAEGEEETSSPTDDR